MAVERCKRAGAAVARKGLSPLSTGDAKSCRSNKRPRHASNDDNKRAMPLYRWLYARRVNSSLSLDGPPLVLMCVCRNEPYGARGGSQRDRPLESETRSDLSLALTCVCFSLQRRPSARILPARPPLFARPWAPREKRTPAMRLFKRRVSDPAPQLVSLAPINAEMDHAALVCQSGADYADYQTVTALPALVVVDEPPRKGRCLCFVHFRFFLFICIRHVRLVLLSTRLASNQMFTVKSTR